MNVELNLEELEQIVEALNQKQDALSSGGTEVLPELQAVNRLYNRLRELREEHENNHDLSQEGVDPTVVSPGAISITATPIAYSCRDRIGHTDSRVPNSAGSAQRSHGVSASLANAAAPVVSESSTC